MQESNKHTRILPENLKDWKVPGYDYDKKDLPVILKVSIEENNGNFYHISFNDLDFTLRRIIGDEKEIMFYPISKNIDEIIENFKDFKIFNLFELANDKYLKNTIKDVKVGITGADAIAAETGSVILCDNSSLKSLATFLPEKHIVISFESKIFPTIFDALKEVYLSFEELKTIQIIQGPSKTGDIEKKIVRPSHGPKELHIIIIKEENKP